MDVRAAATDKLPPSPEELQDRAAALVCPIGNAARVIEATNDMPFEPPEYDVQELVELLGKYSKAASSGNLEYLEAMLLGQAVAMQALFVRLTEYGIRFPGMTDFEMYMRLALKAQNQSRATLDTLARLKNPPTVFAQQANVTSGPQQVNNGMAAASRAGEIETEQTQLSGGTHELLPDARAPGLACGANPALETLGEIDRAEVPRG